MKFQRFSRSQQCPRCHSKEIYRIKRIGFATRIVCKVSDYRPHWCSNCDTFFFALKRPKTGQGEKPLTLSSANQPKVSGKPQADGLAH